MCTARTRCEQSRAQRPSRAHVTCTAYAGRALSMRRPRAQHAQVARIAPRSWAQVATSFPCPALGQVATSLPSRDLLDDQARSRCQSHVATSLLPNKNSPGRDLKKNGAATPVSIGQSESGRDIKLMSLHQMSSAARLHLALPAPARPAPQRPTPQRLACTPRLRAPPYAQMGSSPFQCLHHFFFSFFTPLFFFISFQLLEITQKHIYTYIFFPLSNNPNNFIKIYFL